jgi:hypothetical protein
MVVAPGSVNIVFTVPSGMRKIITDAANSAGAANVPDYLRELLADDLADRIPGFTNPGREPSRYPHRWAHRGMTTDTRSGVGTKPSQWEK